MIELKNLNGAPVVMRNRGMETDTRVLQIIREKPGITIHEIANELEWTNGRVDGSVNRLARKGKVRVQHFIRRKALVKKVYSAEERVRDPNVVEIPKEAIDESRWKNHAYVYSLSRSSIGISATRIVEWEKKAFWKEKVSVEDKVGKFLVKLPEKLSDFYRLENSEVSLSTNDDIALLTIETTIVNVPLPATFPSIPLRQRTRYVLVVDKIEEVAPTSQLSALEFYEKYFMNQDLHISKRDLAESETSLLTVRRREKEHFVTTTQKSETPVQAIVS